MRILQIGKFYPPHPGGMETHLQLLCRGLASRVHLDVVAFGDRLSSEVREDRGVKLHLARARLHVASQPISRNYVKLAQKLSAGADIVHLHHPNPLGNLAIIASNFKGKLVVTYHSDVVRQQILGRAVRPVFTQLWKRTHAFVVNSNRYIDSSPVLRRHRERCHVIPLGIDLQPFTNAHVGKVSEIRETHGNRLILAVGRLVSYKGFNYLIEAMTRVNARLVMVGTGPLRSDLEQLVIRLGLRDKVTFLDAVKDVTPYYQACTLLALPSVTRAEAFALVQVEAMASGKPVVNTALDSGVPFVSVDGLTGTTVPPRDSKALADAINRLLDDPALCARYGEAGRQRARDEFSAEQMVERTFQVYKNVLAE